MNVGDKVIFDGEDGFTYVGMEDRGEEGGGECHQIACPIQGEFADGAFWMFLIPEKSASIHGKNISSKNGARRLLTFECKDYRRVCDLIYKNMDEGIYKKQ